MNKAIILISYISLVFLNFGYGQHDEETKDSLPDKVLHAEPLYIDLIRDLGARKGEQEWNVGFGIYDHNSFDRYEALVEYEFAPIDRLGFEIELPFSFYTTEKGVSRDSIPGNKLESLKLATQWSFLVKKEWGLSIALGYINELEFNNFSDLTENFATGNIYNPFFVVAKRIGSNFHSLLYTGPQFQQHFKSKYWDWGYDVNLSFHYMIPRTSNFIGIEFNSTFLKQDFDMTIRPQMRVKISEETMVGIVCGIPISKEEERFSAFVRLIWEPSPKSKKKK